MRLTNNTKTNYTTRQLKLPLNIEKLIDISDPVYTFCEVMDHIDLSGYFVEKGYKTGRPGCDKLKLLKVVLFSFMEHGICSLRRIEKLCRNDIRYIYLLDDMEAPSFATFGNFIREELTDPIEDIFLKINEYIFAEDHVDLDHAYIDGTKIEANANRYTWVWKKSCEKNRGKVFAKISGLIDSINRDSLGFQGLKLEKRDEYAVEYVEKMLEGLRTACGLDPATFVHGSGHRKSREQRQYEELSACLDRLKTYAERISICGEGRNSYSKTDHDATFMRLKRDYMGNDQLLPAYNLQAAVCDEYIASLDVKAYASDMDCFVPLMEKFNRIYGHYPKYPVADAGYGSYNNYLYCEEHGMEKYMKFTMFEKETKNKRYQSDPYRAVNFRKNEEGDPVCPNGRRFIFKYNKHVRNNRYGRTEEIYECEDCRGCTHRQDCCPKTSGNRTIRMNRELTAIHREVLENLESVHGALLRMNRSIQAEGVFGIIKWDRSYKRLFRRGAKAVNLELTLISCGFNIYKYHNKKHKNEETA